MSEETPEEIINNVLRDVPCGANGWERVENVIKPPPFYLQMYIKRTSNILTLCSEALLPYSYEQTSTEMRNIELLMSFTNVIKTVKKIENKLEIVILSDILQINQTVFCNYSYTEFKDISLTVALRNHFSIGPFVHFVNLCRKEQSGVKYTLYCNIQNQLRNDQIDFLFSMFGYSISFLNEHLAHDAEGHFILSNFKRFNQVIDNKVTLPKVLHQNEIFDIFATNDYSELIIKGRIFLPLISFQQLCTKYNNYISSNSFLFPIVKQIKKTGRLSYIHKETPFLGFSNSMTDQVYGSLLAERGLFVFCQSVPCKDCTFASKEAHSYFEDLISGEMVSWVGHRLEANFYHHWSTPTLKMVDKTKRGICVMSLISTFLLSRIIMLYGLNITVPSLKENLLLQLIDVCSYTNLVNKYVIEDRTKKMKEAKIVQQNETVASSFNLLALSAQLKEHIFDFLPLESLLSLSLCCKTLKLQILSNTNRFETFFELHFNPNTFFLKKERILETQQETSQNNYKTVSLAKFNQVKWTRRLTKTVERFQIFNNSPVDGLFITNSKGYLALSTLEQKCISMPSDMSRKTVLKTQCNSPKAQYNRADNYIQFPYSDTEFCRVSFNTNRYELFTIPKFQDFNFISDNCLVAKNEMEGYIYDTAVSRIVQVFHPTNSPIKLLNEADNGNIICIDSNRKLTGFDRRANQVVFHTPQREYTPLLFDSFGNFLVYGTDCGNIVMYDQRMNQICAERIFFKSPITTLHIGNRRGVFGTSFRSLVYINCYPGWFGLKRTLLRSNYLVTSIALNDEQIVAGLSNGEIVRFS
ncbi:hypothetical protein EIN_253030 [Entamoeba invadens IP1]|uniref:F-box domain-containing protein n=1 Tax=Entamoeba invadens IP1 TaxID=370355 RepID=A0A0A1UGQ2_ENTIV|nr:hypothetical protein EIN_253030 [Entamoeba invadens IP1]ELP95049.1 hypothetical protein EIN_253030 [Entamoeba invadens IP1]|eukprot:XP_004261820.1 hypothetical protein EIN_253030 [Entamoeba invadens IP1]